MRLFWIGFLMTGLLAIGAYTYERPEGRDQSAFRGARAEDGTGFPRPYPSPSPSPKPSPSPRPGPKRP